VDCESLQDRCSALNILSLPVAAVETELTEVDTAVVVALVDIAVL
jgi:hypothetical protein